MKKTALEAEQIKKEIFNFIKASNQNITATEISNLLLKNKEVISKRTINNYLKSLMDDGFITTNTTAVKGRYVSYKTIAQKYEGALTQLGNSVDDEDAVLLREILHLLTDIKAMAWNKKTKQIISSLKAIKNSKIQKKYKDDRILYLQDINTNFDTKMYSNLFDAIVSKAKVKILFDQFFDGQVQEIILHPYYLKQYGGRLNLIAYSETEKMVVHFALERITKASIIYTEKIDPLLKISMVQYTQYLYGIDRRKINEIKTFEVKFNTATEAGKLSAKYFNSNPPFALDSMQIITKKEITQYTFKAIPNFEIQQFLKGFEKCNYRIY